MKKFLPLFLLAAVLYLPQSAYAGLSEGCFPIVQCNSGEDFFANSCQAHVETLTGAGASCETLNGAPAAGKSWAFSCSAGCYQKGGGGGTVNPCPGGVMVSGQCLITLDVVDDDVPVTGTAGYKLWDGADLTTLIHIDTASCGAADQVAVRDFASPTGWSCADQTGLWETDGTNVWRLAGKVGIGTNSPAAPLDVEVSTGGAAEIGANNVAATGDYSVAMGYNTTASDDGSIALGYNARALGWGSAALNGGLASGTSSFATGVSTTASGFRSVAMGSATSATGSQATAMGLGSDASGTNSFAVGSSTTASGVAAMAMGRNSNASGNYSMATGTSSATGLVSTAMGENSLASNQFTFAVGSNATASGDTSVAMGAYSTASGSRSSVLGGWSNDALGHYSMAMGYNVEARSFNSFAFGRYNLDNGNSTTWVSTDPLFTIGNGTDPTSGRSNALTVLKDGKVGIGTASPVTDLTVEGTTGLRVTTGQHPNIYGDMYHAYSGGMVINSNSGGSWADLSFQTNGTTKMFLESAGNLGIGTTAPAYKLHVSDRMKLDGANAGMWVEAGTNDWFVGRTGSNLRFYYGGDKVTFLANGQAGFGIGTPNPNYRMEVLSMAGSTTTNYARFGGGDRGATFRGSWTGIYSDSTHPSSGIGVYGRASNSGGTGVYGYGAAYDFRAAGPGTNYGSVSSARWKENITEIPGALDKVMDLRGVYFDWIESYGGQHDMGMIAEEVGKIVPEIVEFEDDSDYADGMDYGALTPLLTEAIKELKMEKDSEIEELKSIICELKPEAEFCE